MLETLQFLLRKVLVKIINEASPKFRAILVLLAFDIIPFLCLYKQFSTITCLLIYNRNPYVFVIRTVPSKLYDVFIKLPTNLQKMLL